MADDRIDSLVPTSQGAGNMLSSRDRAMTAPGGEPVTPMPSLGEQEDTQIDARETSARHLEHGAGEGSGRSWDMTTGRDWRA